MKLVKSFTLKSVASSRSLAAMSGIIAEIITYRYLLRLVCPPETDSGSYHMIVLPYRYGPSIVGYIDPDLMVNNVVVDIKALIYLLRLLNVVSEPREGIQVFGATGTILSNFIPIPLSKEFKLRIDNPFTLTVELDNSCSYRVELQLFAKVRDCLDKMKMFDLSRYVKLFRSIVNAGYRPDLICMYLREEDVYDVTIRIEEYDYGKPVWRNINAKLGIVRPHRVCIVEIKTSNPRSLKSYTANQRAFLEELAKHGYGDACEYLVLHIPIGDVLKDLKCELYQYSSRSYSDTTS